MSMIGNFPYLGLISGQNIANNAIGEEQLKPGLLDLNPGRNRLINPEFRVDQEFDGAAISIPANTSVKYIVDQWYAKCSVGTVTAQRVSGFFGREYSLQFIGSSTTDTNLILGQRIESADVFDLKNQNVAVSLNMYIQTANQIVRWNAYYPTVKDNFTNVIEIATGTFEVMGSGASPISNYNFSFNAGDNASNGLLITFTLENFPIGEIAVFDQVKLEKSATSEPTEFRGLPIQQELALCQRHWQKLTITIGTASTYLGVPLPVQMRVTPTVTGGSTGFTLDINNSEKVLNCYQNVRAAHTLVFNARL